jgi:hypothetical protein
VGRSRLSWACCKGLTEFLPVSSSAHLRIVGPLLPSGGDPGAAFTAITQIGTEAAVLLYFRRELAAIAVSWWRSLTSLGRHADADSRMGWLILVGTLPIAGLGLLFKDAIETSLRNLYITAAMLIAVRPAAVGGRPLRLAAPHAEGPGLAPRPAVRPGAGAGADPGRVALGRHHHRRVADGLHARGRGALLLPAGGAGGAGLGLLPTVAQRRGRQPGGARADACWPRWWPSAWATASSSPS